MKYQQLNNIRRNYKLNVALREHYAMKEHNRQKHEAIEKSKLVKKLDR